MQTIFINPAFVFISLLNMFSKYFVWQEFIHDKLFYLTFKVFYLQKSHQTTKTNIKRLMCYYFIQPSTFILPAVNINLQSPTFQTKRRTWLSQTSKFLAISFLFTLLICQSTIFLFFFCKFTTYLKQNISKHIKIHKITLKYIKNHK